ncbi:MAG: formylglycine-generating enzyme family protein [Desulfobacterales bacterium]|nr:formylglycine-generating enzyme family protein [Desulfobacterales bacterium]
MQNKNKKTLIILLLFSIGIFFYMYGCSNDETNTSTGSIDFQVQWNESPTLDDGIVRADGKSIDCATAKVSKVSFDVYDESTTNIARSEFNCSDHSGTVKDVPVGKNRSLVVSGKDINGNLLYRGSVAGITVIANKDTYVGLVEMNPFVHGMTYKNSLGMIFKLIAPGKFIMGSPKTESGRYEIEKQHDVTLTQWFYIQTTEVTQGQWQAVMGNNPSDASTCGDDCPIDMVSWNDVQDFISKMNTRGEGLYTIPTEAQWEYCCRAGSVTALSNGDLENLDCESLVLDAVGWYCGNSTYKIQPVGKKNPNAWGLYDMHGNLNEWCLDWYNDEYYAQSPTVDPTGPSSGTTKVRRGGDWNSYARYCRSANRFYSNPGRVSEYVGFRLVRMP